MRLICIDIGNTSTSIGLYERGQVSCVVSIVGGILANFSACMSTLRQIAVSDVNGVCVASVVPKVNLAWEKLICETCGCRPHFISYKSPLGFELDYPAPECIGADRLADAAGVDFGTALNFEVLDDRPAYRGGVIAPGLPLMTSYLHEKTALLPSVELGGKTPEIGRSTEEAIALGARVGYRGIVREILGHLQVPFCGEAKVVATGGYAEWVLNGADMDVLIDSTLTLYGLGVVFEHGVNE